MVTFFMRGFRRLVNDSSSDGSFPASSRRAASPTAICRPAACRLAIWLPGRRAAGALPSITWGTRS